MFYDMANKVHIVPFLIVCSFLLLSQVSYPQYDEVRFEHITIENGLPENSVRVMLQDHIGYLWLGTQNGLVKYDGYSMTVYQPEPDDTNTGWFEGGGLNRFDRTTETFTRYLHNPDDSSSINSNYVLSICEDKSGRLWVGTDKGLNLLNRQTNSFQRFYFHDWVYSTEVYDYLSTLS